MACLKLKYLKFLSKKLEEKSRKNNSSKMQWVAKYQKANEKKRQTFAQAKQDLKEVRES